MRFLKVLMGIGVAIFFVIFLNNLMGILFHGNQTEGMYSRSTSDAYQQCESTRPHYNSNMNYDSAEYKTAQDAYDKCTKDKAREINDKKALSNQYIWLRAIIVLLAMVGVAIALFKKFPFYGGALIGGGLLFALTYPLFARTGFSFDMFSGSDNISENIRTQTQMIKMFSSLLGLIGLTVADIFFFEKHHDVAPVSPDTTIPKS